MRATRAVGQLWMLEDSAVCLILPGSRRRYGRLFYVYSSDEFVNGTVRSTEIPFVKFFSCSARKLA